MILKVLLLLSVFNYQVFAKNTQNWIDPDNDVIPGLSWLFDMEGTPDIDNNIENEKSGVCQSKECKIIANEFKKSMNKSVDPCNNFYDYVCGSLTPDIIPPYKPSWDRMGFFQQVIFRRLYEILQAKPTPDDILPVRQAKKWYRACLDVETLDKRGLKPIESVLMQAGGWPMVIDPEEWDENEMSWQDIEQHYLETVGSYVFFSFEEGTKKNEIFLGQGSLPLTEKLPSEFRDYELDDYEAYADLVKGVVKLFVIHTKADVSKKMIDKDVKDLVEFERELYLIEDKGGILHLPLHELIAQYNKNVTKLNTKEMDADEEDSEIKKIDFHEIFETMLDFIDQNVNDSMKIMINNPNYFLELTRILNETPKRTIVNYMHWHFVSNSLRYTTEPLRNLFFELMENSFGLKERPPRWLECIEDMEMMPAAGYAFAKKFFSDKIDNAGHEMISHIRKQMKVEIEGSSWMDDTTKELVVKKLDNLKVQLGFPEWFNNQTNIMKAYKGLIIGSDHFDNMLSYKKYELKDSLRRALSLGPDMTHLAMTYMDPTEVNAAYYPNENSIQLPLADFQPPLFTSKLPWSVNYGIAGVIIGHEIGHAYDDEGIQHGEDGDETEISKKMMEMYYKRAECFLEQFDKYYGITESDDKSTRRPGKQSKSQKTRGENIADTTGLHSVYNAYMKMINKSMSGSDYKLPGFEEYSDSQMFFISFGSVWCEQVTPEYQKIMLRVDEHSPGPLRVIGGVSNMNAFAEAFKCPKGSPMNPENKCNIWKTKKSSSRKEVKVKNKRKHRKHRSHRQWIID